MKILFAGDLSSYGRTLQRLKALRALGHDVTAVAYRVEDERPGIDRVPFLQRLMWKLNMPLDPAGANKKIIAAAEHSAAAGNAALGSAAALYDIVWIEKGTIIHPATLRAVRAALPQAKIISCSEDDMYARHNRTRWYTQCIPYYDIIFTTKVYNLEELKTLGARRTALFIDAFDPQLHRPLALTPAEQERFGCDVGFIGTFEEDRAQQMLFLAEHRVRVTVWGNYWSAWQGRHANLIIKDTPLYGEDFVRAINATKINLGFLRKRNRDQTTSRSVEIPACGAFLLAERTARHEALFIEGKEAEFFGSREELLAKVKKYVSDDTARRAIAAAGRERCLASGYDVQQQIKNMLLTI